MAVEWIKMKRGMRHDPKVIAMARILCESPIINDLVADPSRVTRHDRVTFAFVTRVTVCGLLDVWSALNSTIKSDGHAPFMTLQDIDDIAEIPDFGKAMEAVGWVTLQDAGGLLFPNFAENNTPTKSRTNAPKSAAQRSKEYRERKKAEKLAQEASQSSRHVTTDKIREDIVISQKGNVPKVDEVKAYAASAPVPITEDCAVAFYDTQEASGWITKHGHPVADWRAALRRYASVWNENNKSKRRPNHRDEKAQKEFPEPSTPLPRL